MQILSYSSAMAKVDVDPIWMKKMLVCQKNIFSAWERSLLVEDCLAQNLIRNDFKCCSIFKIQHNKGSNNYIIETTFPNFVCSTEAFLFQKTYTNWKHEDSQIASFLQHKRNNYLQSTVVPRKAVFIQSNPLHQQKLLLRVTRLFPFLVEEKNFQLLACFRVPLETSVGAIQYCFRKWFSAGLS